ncbi:hypothetical protein CFIMG_003929RAa [Ceratocystis fimbriata CBS 114723]|uniref:Copper acquisition factor BIM1-like domain-containing protein n=1 Tax=Ceratocystis fimbriata CBS 114723 TaxID=1035309 RepID=A0A2C5WVV0_9PEZI|nr:hypothetical protein CFIMG_003929RAa [Ceratocystis fimbriata CBS 114723]
MWPSLVTSLLTASVASAHILLTYPGSRGNSFITNDTFPFGMQWTYPCGGIPLSRNRTYWSVNGGSIAFQPGWFSGHASAMLYVNIGLDSDGPDGGPMNFTNQLVMPFELQGPSNGPFPGTMCLPNVQVPASLGVTAGMNASLQIVELATHGASLFACSDITFVEPDDSRIPASNESICFNSTDFGFGEVYTAVVHEASPVRNSSAKSAAVSSQHLQNPYWPFSGPFLLFIVGLLVVL